MKYDLKFQIKICHSNSSKNVKLLQKNKITNKVEDLEDRLYQIGQAEQRARAEIEKPNVSFDSPTPDQKTKSTKNKAMGGLLAAHRDGSLTKIVDEMPDFDAEQGPPRTDSSRARSVVAHETAQNAMVHAMVDYSFNTKS